MADPKPAYLVHGDDDVKLDAWRRRVRERVVQEDAELDLFRDQKLIAQDVAEALGLLTLGTGRRWIVADGVQDWKEKDVTPVAEALKDVAPETTAVFFTQANPKARRGSPASKGHAPGALAKAVEKAGGEVRLFEAPKPRSMAKWVLDRAKEMDLRLDREAADALVEAVGFDENRRPRLRRLLRELEKLALFVPEGAPIGRETVEAVTASDVPARVHEMADALIAGDRQRALVEVEELRLRGEPVTYVIFGVLRKALDVRGVWGALEAGRSRSDLAKELKMPDWMVRRLADEAARADGERLERAVHELAELDWAVRGGGKVGEEAALTLAVIRAAA